MPLDSRRRFYRNADILSLAVAILLANVKIEGRTSERGRAVLWSVVNVGLVGVYPKALSVVEPVRHGRIEATKDFAHLWIHRNGARQRAGAEGGMQVRIARRLLVGQVGNGSRFEKGRFCVPDMGHCMAQDLRLSMKNLEEQGNLQLSSKGEMFSAEPLSFRPWFVDIAFFALRKTIIIRIDALVFRVLLCLFFFFLFGFKP